MTSHFDRTLKYGRIFVKGFAKGLTHNRHIKSSSNMTNVRPYFSGTYDWCIKSLPDLDKDFATFVTFLHELPLHLQKQIQLHDFIFEQLLAHSLNSCIKRPFDHCDLGTKLLYTFIFNKVNSCRALRESQELWWGRGTKEIWENDIIPATHVLLFLLLKESVLIKQERQTEHQRMHRHYCCSITYCCYTRRMRCRASDPAGKNASWSPTRGLYS